MNSSPLPIEHEAYFSLIGEPGYQDGLSRIYRVLRERGFERVARVPTYHDRFALPKFPGRLLNVFTGRQNVVLNYDAFPALLQWVFRARDPEGALLFRLFVQNQPCGRDELLSLFTSADLESFLEHRVLVEASDPGRYVFTSSFYPFEGMILVRDSAYYYDPYPNIAGRVWAGSDTVACSRLIAARLRDRRFDRGLEVGVGSGTLALSVAPQCREFVGIDINQRALLFSEVNAELNERPNVRLLYSDLYEKLEGSFDLIIANPFYCQLESGGFEEVPALVDGLDTHLRTGGVAYLYVNSYVKDGVDLVQSLVREKFGSLDYAIELQTLGYSIERHRLSQYAEHGLSHIVSYLIELQKGARPSFEVKPPGLMRSARDRAYIAAVRGLYGGRG